nr:PREDICTED: microsomal triglyceride transfer protein large subunit-like [Apteryx mantelli mantelli]
MNPQAVSGYICLLCLSFGSTARGNLQPLSFQPGILYQYHYSLDVQLDYMSKLSLQGSWLKAEALVQVHRLWRHPGGEELLQVQIQDLKAQHAPEHKRSQDGAGDPSVEIALSQETQAELQQPVFISWNSGKVKAFYGNEAESPLISNLKRGLISLLQVQPHPGTAVEEDASGSCQVMYTVSNDSAVKTKDLLSCTKPNFGFASVNKIFGVQWQPTSKSLYLVKDNLIQSVLAEESHVVSLSLRSTTGIKISSRQQLELVSSSMPGPAEVPGQSLEDAAVAAQSAASLAALADFLDFSKDPSSLLEKFLYAAAFSPQPSKELLSLVLDKLQGKRLAPEVWETGIVIIGSLISKLCRQNLCGSQEVERGVETILQGLGRAKEESEVVIYLVSLRNALLPETIPTLLHYAEEGPAAVAAAAVAALQGFPTQHISGEVKRAMRRIFHEKRKSYEKTCRLTAAEILLDNKPLPMDVINILLATKELETEMATLLQLKVQNSLHAEHHPARKILKDVMRDPQINNYNYFSKPGISSAFSGPLTVTQDLLSTFGLELLFTEGGFLRKSLSDFSLFSRGHRLHVAQVTIEAQGMESMLGENTLEGEEEPELMAGMSATFFDVQLRPIVFFQGYTDLMAKVLLSSGEPTSVVRGNLLLMDHHQVIPLQSGLQVVIKLQGGLGLDISANMDVSIWEQELKTSISTRGSLAIDFQTELDAPFFQTTMRSQTEVETSIHFDTVLRFSASPVLMCLQLREDQVPYREIFTVSKSAGSQSSTMRKGRQGTVAGREFALHGTNSKMCNLLLREDKE